MHGGLGMIGLTSPFSRYGVAIAIVAIAAAIRVSLNTIWDVGLPYFTFYPAVMLSGWLGGLGPGLAATAFSALLADYFWLSPGSSLAIANPADALGLVLFVVMGVFISTLNEAWRRSTRGLAESEERFRVTLTSIGDAVITTDAETRVTGLNPVAEALTGWTQAEALGRSLSDVFTIIDERSRKPAVHPVPRVLREGLIAGLANHTVLVSRDGKEIPIDDSAAPIRFADGTIGGAVLIFRDVTERRRAERRLKESERRQAAILEAALDCVITIDQEGKIVDFNPAAERTFGRRRADVLGREMADLIIPRSLRQRHRQGLAHYLATGEGPALGKRLELTALRSDGTEFPIELAIIRISSEGPPMFTGYVRDISERRAAERDREVLLARAEEARVEAETANFLKDEFLATVSHELRTPLNAMLGWADMLQSGKLDDRRAARAVQAIYANARRQTQLVEDLLDTSRIISGKVRLDIAKVDLTTVIRAAIDVVTPAAESKGIRVEADLDPAVGPISADPMRLQQVVWNLLSNAVKFTPAGGRVGVRMRRQGERAEVSVWDTGIGISTAFLPHVFERFRQAETGTTKSEGGLGLGLSIVRHLVELHGGTVRADSAGEGSGAAFTVSLPVRAVLPGPQPEEASGVTATTAAPEPSPAEQLPPLANVSVLVVDDDADAREVVAVALQQCGAHVVTAGSANEAFDALERHSPDVLLVDIAMPGEDGYSLIEKVRAFPSETGARIPAAALTAHARPEDRERALQAGFDLHLVKPLDVGVVCRAVAELATLRRTSHEPLRR